MNNKERIEEIERQLQNPTFWDDKESAQKIIRELNELKAEGGDPYDNSIAVLTIISGAGGVDAEDFARILFEMYKKYIQKNNWDFCILNENENEHGGFKSITIEIDKKGSYKKLKKERGVHRLVRVSPFNAKRQRHTSFALVDVVPEIPEVKKFEINDADLEISLARSSGPGGQNVNKRETSVRIKHIPTNISVHVETERSQAQNKEKAMEILCGKLFSLLQSQRVEKIQDLKIEKSIEWSNQIRSYVLNPYKLVKDNRVDYEERDPEKVFDGNIEGFIKALEGYCDD